MRSGCEGIGRTAKPRKREGEREEINDTQSFENFVVLPDLKSQSWHGLPASVGGPEAKKCFNQALLRT